MQGKVYLETDRTVVPSVMPPVHIPVLLKEKLKSRRDLLTQKKIISPIQEPKDWFSSMIEAKEPDGNIRFCLDSHCSNKALKGAITRCYQNRQRLMSSAKLI